MVTVILTCWRRFANLEAIVSKWLSSDLVGEVILWDNSQEADLTPQLLFERAVDETQKLLSGAHPKDVSPKLIVIRSSHNFGASARYGLADLAANDWLLYADDDYMPRDGLVEQLLDGADSELDVVGIKGRLFNHSYHDNTEVRSEELPRDSLSVEVDMLVGHIMLVHKSLMLPFSYREASWFCCELEWEARVREQFPGVKLWVVPCVGVQELTEASDKHSLYRDRLADSEKRAIWEQYYQGRCLCDHRD